MKTVLAICANQINQTFALDLDRLIVHVQPLYELFSVQRLIALMTNHLRLFGHLRHWVSKRYFWCYSGSTVASRKLDISTTTPQEVSALEGSDIWCDRSRHICHRAAIILRCLGADKFRTLFYWYTKSNQNYFLDLVFLFAELPPTVGRFFEALTGGRVWRLTRRSGGRRTSGRASFSVFWSFSHL